CPPPPGSGASDLEGGAAPVDVPPPEQPASAARTPPVSVAAASLAVRPSRIRNPTVCSGSMAAAPPNRHTLSGIPTWFRYLAVAGRARPGRPLGQGVRGSLAAAAPGRHVQRRRGAAQAPRPAPRLSSRADGPRLELDARAHDESLLTGELENLGGVGGDL